MVLLVNEILNWSYSRYRDKIVRVHRIVGNNPDDSARRYEIRDPELESRYQKWLKGNLTIDLYYGSATVD